MPCPRLRCRAWRAAVGWRGFGAVGADRRGRRRRPPTVDDRQLHFSPPTLTVAAGTTVTWTNNDDIPHTVRAVDGSFHSKAMDTADSYTFTFTKPGVYSYFCSLHPKMVGKVIVK